MFDTAPVDNVFLLRLCLHSWTTSFPIHVLDKAFSYLYSTTNQKHDTCPYAQGHNITKTSTCDKQREKVICFGPTGESNKELKTN